MKVIEYGIHSNKTIMLLHGGGLSWWQYRMIAERLQDEYHVILPVLDGHAGSSQEFISIEKNADELIDYVDKNFQGSLYLLGGCSLGGQIAAEMMSKRCDICTYAVLESVLVKPMKLTHLLVKPMLDASFGLIQKRWFSKLQFHSLKIKNDLFEEYYRDTCSITKQDMIAFLKANSNYTLKSSLADTNAEVLIVVGENEQRIMIDSAKSLHHMISKSRLEIKENLYHGEYSINCTEEYLHSIQELIQKRS